MRFLFSFHFQPHDISSVTIVTIQFFFRASTSISLGQKTLEDSYKIHRFSTKLLYYEQILSMHFRILGVSKSQAYFQTFKPIIPLFYLLSEKYFLCTNTYKGLVWFCSISVFAFIFILCIDSLHACMSVNHTYAVLVEAKEGTELQLAVKCHMGSGNTT